MNDKVRAARAEVVQAASQAYHEQGEAFEVAEFERALDAYADAVRAEHNQAAKDEHTQEMTEYD